MLMCGVLELCVLVGMLRALWRKRVGRCDEGEVTGCDQG